MGDIVPADGSVRVEIGTIEVHTPYDSPAIWKARPLNEGKFSKKIATNAAISLAASSDVLCGPSLEMQKKTVYEDVRGRHVQLTGHVLRKRSQRR